MVVGVSDAVSVCSCGGDRQNFARGSETAVARTGSNCPPCPRKERRDKDGATNIYLKKVGSALVGALAGGSAGIRFGLLLVLPIEIKRHGCADEILQCRIVDLVAFVDVDGAADIALEAGVE